MTLDLPDELVAVLGSPETITARAREAFVLDLLRQGEISQGVAARILGITRGDILDLMAHHRIPAGPRTAAEVDEELTAARIAHGWPSR